MRAVRNGRTAKYADVFVRYCFLPILGWLFLAVASVGLAQSPDDSYLVDTWLTEQGLPENIVNAIAQTPDGYLWCGTTHGLARFDGVRFKIFNTQNTPELGTARIRQLFVGRDGALWISIFEGGLIRFQNGTFTAFSLPPRESTAKTIFWIIDDETGALWLTVEDGAVYRFSDGRFTFASEAWTTEPRQVFHVFRGASGEAWAASSNGLARIVSGKLSPALQGKPWQYTVLCPSRSGGWWIVTGGHVRLWQNGEWMADAGPWTKPDRTVESCLEDRWGHVWVATLGKGVFRYSTNAPPREITVKDGLGSDLVRALFEDSEGNLWVGTRPGGLNRLRPSLFKTVSRKDGLTSDLVTAICEGKSGELWVGTDGDGMNRITGNEIAHFDKQQGLDTRPIRSALLDHQGVLWVGSWVGGLFRLEDDHFAPVVDIPGHDKPIASMFEDSKNRIWLGQRTLNKLNRIENGTLATIDLPNPAAALDIIVITEDSEGNIWIGTDGSGLFCWNGSQCRRFTRQDGLPSDTVRSLRAEPGGTLWIGTVDGGLCRLKNNRFATISTADGLVDDVINNISDDGRGYYWFSSFQGIFRASKQDLNDFADGKRAAIKCLAFGKSDGLPALECPGGFQPAGCRTADGRLWFPTIKGLVSVDPSNIPTNPVVPPVLIEEISVDGQSVVNKSADGRSMALPFSEVRRTSALQINPGRHRFDFRYTAVNLTAPERVRFRTRLDGLEKDWVDSGTQRTVNYNDLPLGNYQFHVTACNQSGVWNEAGASLAFVVLPYFWQTWWFLTISILAGAGAVAGTVYFTLSQKWRRQLRRVEMQLSLEKERTRIAQDIHDGVGANLTEIAWLAEVAEKDATDPAEVRAQTRKISSTARETVRSFDEIVWAVLPQNDTLRSLVDYLGQRVDELFENTPTRCWFTAPNDLPNIVVPAEVRHSFYLACKETLHNVNKHAHATEVKIGVVLRDSQLRVEIEDNGNGFDISVSNDSRNGLRNLRQRFADLGGRFELQSLPGKGTHVTMTIPLNHQSAN